MNKLNDFSNPEKMNLDKYDDLVEYFEERFNVEGMDISVEYENRMFIRFDFLGERSIWLTGSSIEEGYDASLEGSLRKGTQKIMKRIIENAPVKITNYIRYQ